VAKIVNACFSITPNHALHYS